MVPPELEALVPPLLEDPPTLVGASSGSPPVVEQAGARAVREQNAAKPKPEKRISANYHGAGGASRGGVFAAKLEVHLYPEGRGTFARRGSKLSTEMRVVAVAEFLCQLS